MRHLVSGLVAAVAVVTVSAVPAMACGGGLFTSCSPCGAYASPCAQPQVYVPPVAPTYSYGYGCNSCGGAYERLPEPVDQYHTYTSPVHQYYYADQGPTYSGPGNFAPYPTYRESEGPVVYGPRYHHWHHRFHSYRTTRYAPAPFYYGHRVLRRYY
jgi:hypothetical protein